MFVGGRQTKGTRIYPRLSGYCGEKGGEGAENADRACKVRVGAATMKSAIPLKCFMVHCWCEINKIAKIRLLGSWPVCLKGYLHIHLCSEFFNFVC